MKVLLPLLVLFQTVFKIDGSGNDYHLSSDTACQDVGTDFVFILDSSNSVGQTNFDTAKRFLAKLSRSLSHGNTDQNDRISLISFGTEVNPVFDFNVHSSGDALSAAILSAEFSQSGGSSVGEAMLYALNGSFSPTNGGRARVLFVITDGRSYDSQSKISSAHSMAQGGAITIWAFGIGNCKEVLAAILAVDHSQLVAIAGDVSRVLQVESFDAILSRVAQSVCTGLLGQSEVHLNVAQIFQPETPAETTEATITTTTTAEPDTSQPMAIELQPDATTSTTTILSTSTTLPPTTTTTTTTTALSTSPTTTTVINVCELEALPGVGSNYTSPWYYDAATNKCIQFIYRGSGGNGNNFESKEACQAACGFSVWVNPCSEDILEPTYCTGAASDCGGEGSDWFCHLGSTAESTVCCPTGNASVCLTTRSEGVGSERLLRYYYDQGRGRCLPFIYKGTRGNANNFVDRDVCEIACQVWEDACEKAVRFPIFCDPSKTPAACPSGYWCHNGASLKTTICCPRSVSNICSLALSTGAGGLTSLSRWYYTGKECKRFRYRGLKGNQNSFPSKEECDDRCP